ncbi:MAG: thioredoxin family protein [Holophagaceae bacterium]|nr:thioredoxin family protein [Holophagaceae bacterium]
MSVNRTVICFLALIGFLPLLGQDFDPERDITASYRNGAVILNVPFEAHASGITVSLKPGQPGKLVVGDLPSPSGVDSLDSPYWSGNIRIPVKGEGLKTPVVLIVSFLSCMEGEGGQCFPPVDLELSAKAEDIPSDSKAKSEPPIQQVPSVSQQPASNAHTSGSPSAFQNSKEVIDTNENHPNSAPGLDAIVENDSNLVPPPKPKDGLVIILILFFLGGIGASLTPCVLPMIPITMAVIGAKGASKARGALLGIVLTQGMALTYTILGVIAARTGSVFGQFAQQPVFLIPVSVIFALFAISLFGAFEIKLPDSLSNKLQGSGQRKGFLGAFVTGLVLGPLSAPCVGPLIGSAIMDIGLNGQVFEGALKMFIFAQGMGVLFIIGGISVSALPKSGDWLTRFKQTLGLIILAFAAWNIRLIVPEWTNHFMWAIVLLFASGVYGAFEVATGLIGHIRKGIALLSLAMAILLGIRATELYLDLSLLPKGGSASGLLSDDPHSLWIEHDFEEAKDKAAKQGKLVLVDTFTSWCAQCKELDEKTWPDPTIVDWIRKNAVAVRIDTEKVRPDLAKPLGIVAYPTVVLMDANGRELRRLNGFHRPAKMLEWLNQ